ncbi:unnamed protein product [Symbiodinium sp. CCMP2592]|nr:unnamed protein product [Symbiodinium sp. CCMP2592]
MSDESQHQPEQEDENQEELPIRIFTAITIEGAGLKKATWQPAVQVVSGCNYIKLTKWDRDLTLFVTGKGLRLHSGKEHNINRQWFSTVAELRKEACQESLKRVIKEAAEAEGTPIPQKIRAATQQDEYLAGRTVQVLAPAVQNADGDEVHAEHQMTMLWGIKGEQLWVELTTENLNYVRLAILHSSAAAPAPPKRARGKAAAGSPKRRKRGRKPHKPLRDEDQGSEPEQEAVPIAVENM